jgi:hypothetical protein
MQIEESKVPVCRHFVRWRDPDSNRGHHDFQGARRKRDGRKRPANRLVSDRVTPSRYLPFPSVPRGFGTPRAPRSPNRLSHGACVHASCAAPVGRATSGDHSLRTRSLCDARVPDQFRASQYLALLERTIGDDRGAPMHGYEQSAPRYCFPQMQERQDRGSRADGRLVLVRFELLGLDRRARACR